MLRQLGFSWDRSAALYLSASRFPVANGHPRQDNSSWRGSFLPRLSQCGYELPPIHIKLTNKEILQNQNGIELWQNDEIQQYGQSRGRAPFSSTRNYTGSLPMASMCYALGQKYSGTGGRRLQAGATLGPRSGLLQAT